MTLGSNPSAPTIKRLKQVKSPSLPPSEEYMLTQIYKTFTLYMYLPVIAISSLWLCDTLDEFQKFYALAKKTILA